MAFVSRRSLIAQPPTPKTEAQRLQLCGAAPERDREEYWQAHGDEHAEFMVVGAKDPPKKVDLWRIFRDVLGFEPDLTPQPTGNCVAAAVDDIIELVQGIEIGLGQSEEFHPIYNPYHYATGRVIVGNNRLKGGAGSIGGWQAKAVEKYGCIRLDQDGLPKYNKRNCDAWGDDKPAEGKEFRDFLTQGTERIIRATARVRTVDDVVTAISNLYPCSIAANFGYKMKANDPRGVMGRGTAWGHQMSVWAYDLVRGTVTIKNQWGDVHGKLIDPDDDTELPRGFIRTDMETFEKHMARAECITFSDFQGFPAQSFDFGKW